MKRVIPVFIGLGYLLLLSVPAFAECDIVPNGTTILAPETRPAGTVIYNKDYEVLQVCLANGTWQALGPVGEGPDPCESGPVGTVCASDGAIYAGTTVGGARMYVANADEVGTYIYGGYGTDLNGDNNTVPPELRDDGLANTNWLLTHGEGDHDAAQACRDRGAGWYLPAIDELGTLYANRAQLSTANLPTSTSWYWSSSESLNNGARIQRFSDGVQGNFNKYNAYLVRCVRR